MCHLKRVKPWTKVRRFMSRIVNSKEIVVGNKTRTKAKDKN